MLVLTRKRGQSIFIGDQIKVTVGRLLPDGKIRICIDAPKDVKVIREELAALPAKS